MDAQLMILQLQQRKKKTSHILHLLLSVITGGLWLIIWACCSIANASQNSKIDKEIEQIQAWQQQQMQSWQQQQMGGGSLPPSLDRTWPPKLDRK